LLNEAVQYLLAIAKARIPLLRRHILIEAKGIGEVREAVIAEVDRDWRYKPGSERTLQVDTVCIGYGFVPATELSWLAACEHCYEPEFGGWIPVRSVSMETSIEGVYCAGDCSGIGGKLVAIEEGRIAGIAIAQSLGRLSAQRAARLTQPCLKRLKRLESLRRELNRISLPGPGLHELARSDTSICRCQDVTLGELEEAIMRGANDLNELKRMTRIGMGHCQGRMCGPALQSIIARRRGVLPQVVRYLNARAPVRSLPLRSLAGHTS
jgi:D-hydroxyproline dehydrogenase subunit alpha